ncbi:hypothetical protein SADUNF_Sadunf17G0108800 [Salix dunnii]|uniref:Elongator complex protein 5 n=1 Tax=Salix dunnii TaxID=1413687 RepID=A0A835J8I6_9ROSI|nr:hypothetical protein SADUNF_Sadunf17G0108800 [Salix dunnii]
MVILYILYLVADKVKQMERKLSFQILDCYSDPLGWKDQLKTSGNFTDVSYEASLSLSCVCKNVKDFDRLYSLILELGKEQISSVVWLLHSDLHEVKVQFYLDLSVKERIGRAKVVLPFEHQGCRLCYGRETRGPGVVMGRLVWDEMDHGGLVVVCG